LQRKQPIAVRNPNATRPWQHVLEPLSGYLWLAAKLSQPLAAPKRLVSPKSDEGGSEGVSTFNPQLASAFNFGPAHEANRAVRELVAEVLKHWPGRWEDRSDPKAVHEAGLLQLSTDKAHALLGWLPVWSFPTAVERTVSWYRETTADPRSASALAVRQIGQYQADAAQAGLSWVAR
jgi:CDP-glucose 4,6-dehydratase